ncbi:putative outer membrane protein [Aequoribacter fuscus]|jgi:outer membrane protein|uniref:Putative outer membrane protein n=1 Tax=Aequoribacter fuscus TaxID=2518989 RepID=F3L2G9_9GAMM|nr:MipA/OmpV family protein [Aequoribacter fuscus]EGG29448.1 putative outer membrane protein [Aequoribacter fuscus]QHJ89000.1 MipA/OmpV family protein [Aequoribacter fuscus]
MLILRTIIAVVFGGLLAANAPADDASTADSPDYPGWKELWSDLTLGVGIAAVDYPHYPGSPQSDTLVAPLPYLEYEGDWLSIDRDGIQASLFKSDRAKLDISVSGSLPVNNDDDILREGMNDLELILEVGPELELKLAQWGNNTLELHLPLRAALELDPSNGIEPVGWVFDPRVHYEWRTQSTEFEIDLGAYTADQEYNQLLYGVSQPFATLARPQYRAKSGLVGYRLSSTIQYDVGAWSFLAYARYMDLGSAKNTDSPLFVDDSYVLFGVGAIWRFKYADSD